MEDIFFFFSDSRQHPRGQHQARELDMTVLDMIIVKSAVRWLQALISKFQCKLSANQKKDSEFNV